MTPPLWKAVYALRKAESLAQLGTVAGGPADAPPDKPEDETSWVQDWVKRAKDALRRAEEMHGRGIDVLKERAAEIARTVRAGAAEVLKGARNVARGVLDEVHEPERTAQAAANAWSGTQAVVALMILGALALYYLPRRGRA